MSDKPTRDPGMERQLAAVRQAYDLTVEQYQKAINPLDHIPPEIRSSPFFQAFYSGRICDGSSQPDIADFLGPQPGWCFLDAGCSANLFNYRLDYWPSTYYGVDISLKLIAAMKNFVKKEGISIGGLYVAEIANLPFEKGFFDIAAVTGVLEYCTMDYICAALVELKRVLKTPSRAFLDIPNSLHPYGQDMAKLEDSLKRPIFLHSRPEFEKILKTAFQIQKVDDSGVMIKYYVNTQP